MRHLDVSLCWLLAASLLYLPCCCAGSMRHFTYFISIPVLTTVAFMECLRPGETTARAAHAVVDGQAAA